MNLPERITQAESLEHNKRLHTQVGGHIFRNGEQFGYPAGYPTGPASTRPATDDDTVKLSTHIDRKDEK